MIEFWVGSAWLKAYNNCKRAGAGREGQSLIAPRYGTVSRKSWWTFGTRRPLRCASDLIGIIYGFVLGFRWVLVVVVVVVLVVVVE